MADYLLQLPTLHRNTIERGHLALPVQSITTTQGLSDSNKLPLLFPPVAARTSLSLDAVQATAARGRRQRYGSRR